MINIYCNDFITKSFVKFLLKDLQKEFEFKIKLDEHTWFFAINMNVDGSNLYDVCSENSDIFKCYDGKYIKNIIIDLPLRNSVNDEYISVSEMFYSFLWNLSEDNFEVWDKALGGYTKAVCFKNAFYLGKTEDIDNWFKEQKFRWNKFFKFWKKENEEKCNEFVDVCKFVILKNNSKKDVKK